ncbi:MAG: aldose 1-epimerase family protein [Clostridiaceae bacterium]
MNKILMKRLGNMDQLAGIRLSRLESGNAAGKRIAEVYNAAGLRFSVLPDKCMDLFDLSYQGVNLSFHSKNALSAGEPFYPVPSEFFGYWSGGMLATCGLSNIGGADESDPACIHPIHGRIGYQSADCFGYDCAWQGDDYILSLEGRMRETRLYGRSLELHRRIQTRLNASEIEITDTITNCSDVPEPIFLLYHFNFGYPLLCEDSVFFCPPSEQIELSDVGDRNSRSMNAPVDGAAQQTFRHRPLSGGEIVSGLYNPKLELAAYLRFDSAELPYFLEWKCMKSHDYVLAIEPVNCPAKGRASDLASGDVPVLGAYESISYRVVLGVSEGEAAKKLISESKS